MCVWGGGGGYVCVYVYVYIYMCIYMCKCGWVFVCVQSYGCESEMRVVNVITLFNLISHLIRNK